jgi:hypothetical protein
MLRAHFLCMAILLLLFAVTVGTAQGLYVTANAGYAFGAGTQYFGGNYDYTKTPVPIEGVHGSFGEGFKFGVSAGYMFSGNLGAELGFAYWLGKTFEMQGTFTTGVGVRKQSGSGFVAVPSIVVSANTQPVSAYARVGLVLGILKVKNGYESHGASGSQDIMQEETGNLAFGYAGAIGLLVPAGRTVAFFVEASIHTVTYSPDQIEYSKYLDNGVDRLPVLDPKVYKYKESFNNADEGVYMAARRPFSSAGLAVGVRINL